ncbi:hypothetical protein RSOLAG1IB_09312 [Rhizoctonia solani AG-1 IB]|uniref:Oxidoreductase AflY n=1 Tax=Thanatephorus cucumeris (strain AG1-IB / isolate 7/3/14) TaxID=1108050 RepID=A0A0B7FT72_THACB|nr:hypothetical protein RSOLAG1IB_09312 [Rhizoctonia solani AG-1 IB]
MVAPTFDDGVVDSLFTAPTFAAGLANPVMPIPDPFPGRTPESTATLRRLLIESHKRFHVFFNEMRLHNHIAHHLFAAYGIGANAHVLQKAFDNHASYLRPAYQSPEAITYENWKNHLGNEDFYNAYLNFFAAEIKNHGVPSTLERYVFSHDANWGQGEPRMMDRFLSGVLHPIIHFAHAPEFGVDGMAVEGLAQTAVHDASLKNLLDQSLFTESNKKSRPESPDRVHSFTVLSRILADDRLKAGAACNEETFVRSVEASDNVGAIVREYASLWTVQEDENDIRECVEELSWLVALLFGVGGWKKDTPFCANFFLAHLVTSCLFLPSVLSILKLEYQVNLIRAYFANVLICFIGEGRPTSDISGFFQSVSTDPKPDHNSKSNIKAADENPWYTILGHTIHHQDEHLIKAVRALAHSATLYGAGPKGYFSHTELRGAEEIDGTLFVRTAGLLMEALHWDYEVTNRVEGIDEGNGWYRAGLGWE